MKKTWLKQYPAGVPTEVAVGRYASLVALLDETMRRHRDLPALRFMGRDIGYGPLDEFSRALAAYLQKTEAHRFEGAAAAWPSRRSRSYLGKTGRATREKNPQGRWPMANF